MTSKSFVSLILLFFFSLLMFLSVYTYRKLQLYHYKSVYEAKNSSPAEIKRVMQEMSEAGNPAVPILSELLSKENDPEKLRLILGSLLRIHTPEAIAAASNTLFVLDKQFKNEPWLSLSATWENSAHKVSFDDLKLCRLYLQLRSVGIKPAREKIHIEGVLSALAAVPWFASLEDWMKASEPNDLAEELLVRLALLGRPPLPQLQPQAEVLLNLLLHECAEIRLEAWLAVRDVAPHHIGWNPLQPDTASTDSLRGWLLGAR